MSVTQVQVKDHKYLVCAIYDQIPVDNITRVDHVGIVSASSPFSAVVKARKNHNPGEVKPTKYVASLILGPFKVNAFSNQTFACEELITTRIG